jgi:uroporphyrinogen decarboxylase
MSTMTHRDRVLKALGHEETDRPPIDFGGSHETGIQADAYAALLDRLGFEPEQIDAREIGEEATIIPGDRVQARFDTDVRGTSAMIGAVDDRTRIDDLTAVDGWGVTWQRSDTASPYINIKGPLQHLESPTAADVDALPWPDPTAPEIIDGLRDYFLKMREETDYALIIRLRNVGGLYLAQRLRGFGEYLMDLVVNQSFAEALQERGAVMVCEFARTVLEEVGDLVDGVSWADDLGMQTQPLMNPELYRKAIKPYHQRLGNTIRSNTDAKVILHSCGAIQPLLGDLIDCGVDVINPVQVNASGMDPAELKKEFGADLSFWGGIDTQQILPFGTVEDVVREVRARKNDLGDKGGWTVAAVHNIRAEVPPENVIAMYDTVLEMAE